MRRHYLLSVVCGVLAALAFAAVSVDATIIRVPEHHTKVQQAIDAARSGDTVLVAAGRYAPSANAETFAITMKNGLQLIGAGADLCTLDAEQTARVISCRWISDAATRIEGFTITNGVSYLSLEGGGGICCQGSSPIITNNIITGNSGGARGGGISCSDQSFPTITHNTIRGNTADTAGGIYCQYSFPTIAHNMISQNQASVYGAGVHCECSSPNITNNLITDNTTSYVGGGIFCWMSSSPTITNNIIVGNSAEEEGGGMCLEGASQLIINNIITGNRAAHGGGLYCWWATPTITHTNLWRNTPDDYRGCEPGTGCISADPLFVDQSVGDYHLRQGSPCIDAGDNNAPDLPEFDFDINPRVVDGDGNGIPVVDMGAFEYQVSVSVTGAGWIPGDPPIPGNKKAFGFTVSSREVVGGHLGFRDNETKMKVHSDSIRTLWVGDGQTVAHFSGDCHVDEQSGYAFKCDIEDRGDPGRDLDAFSIHIYRPNGDPYYSVDGILEAGNIRIKGTGDGTATAETVSIRPRLMLPQNSPNPVASRASIMFTLLASDYTSLKVYDSSGRLVETLVEGKLSPGLYTAAWNTDGATSGIYFYELTSGSLSATRKLVVLK